MHECGRGLVSTNSLSGDAEIASGDLDHYPKPWVLLTFPPTLPAQMDIPLESSLYFR